MRFRLINSAEAVYKESRKIRSSVLGPLHPEAQVVYVIPDKSIEDLKVQEAAQRNEAYDPCKDETLTCDQMQTFINEKNEQI